MNAVDRARALVIAVKFMRGKEAGSVAAEAIRAAEADARREALEEAARAIAVKVVCSPETLAWMVESVRALASQKGEP